MCKHVMAHVIVRRAWSKTSYMGRLSILHLRMKDDMSAKR